MIKKSAFTASEGSEKLMQIRKEIEIATKIESDSNLFNFLETWGWNDRKNINEL